MKSCSCEDWESGIQQIDGAITLATIHGQKYTGDVFQFCPWCGKKIR